MPGFRCWSGCVRAPRGTLRQASPPAPTDVKPPFRGWRRTWGKKNSRMHARAVPRRMRRCIGHGGRVFVLCSECPGRRRSCPATFTLRCASHSTMRKKCFIHHFALTPAAFCRGQASFSNWSHSRQANRAPCTAGPLTLQHRAGRVAVRKRMAPRNPFGALLFSQAQDYTALPNVHDSSSP